MRLLVLIEKIKKRIAELKPGAIFTPATFGLLGSPTQIANALKKLVESGDIRKLGHGVYYYPKYDANRRELPPDIDLVAKSIAEKLQQTVLSSSETAAYHFGFLPRPPEKITYLTDGPTRVRQVGEHSIYFRNVTKKSLTGAGHKSGLVFQALRHVGKDNITDETIEQIKLTLTDKEKRQILQDYVKTPIWMHTFAKRIAE